MKTILITLLVSPLLLFGQARTADELNAAQFQKYASKSGKISYEITGAAKGEEVMVFDVNGWNSMRKQSMVFELYGIQTMQTLFEIIDGDFVYRLNDGDSTYTSRTDFKWSQQAAYKKPDQSSEAILLALGGTYNSDSTLLDRSCQVWTFEGKALQELWIWQGLVLKRRTKLGDRIIYTIANTVELDVQVDPEFFVVPSYMNKKE